MSNQISSLNYDDSTSAGRKMVQLIQALEEVSSNAIHFFLRIGLFLCALPLFFSSTISRHSLSPFNTEKVKKRIFLFAVTATLLAFELPKGKVFLCKLIRLL